MDISFKFDNLDKMRIMSSYSKENLGRSGKGLITSLGLKAKVRPHKLKKARYAIGNVSEKEFLKIIKEFEKIGKLSYDKRGPNMSLLPDTFI